MNSNTVDRERVSSVFLEKREGRVHKISVDETISLLFYIAEKKRKKPKLLSRFEEEIDAISIIYYPLKYRLYRNGKAVVFDAFRENEKIIEYRSLDEELLNKLLNELSELTGKSFLSKLIELRQCIASGHKPIITKRYVFKHLLIKQEIVQEIHSFIYNYLPGVIHGVCLPARHIPDEKVLNILKEIENDTSNATTIITQFLSNLKKIIEQWKKEIDTQYDAEIKELEKKLFETNRGVSQRILQLKEELNNEVRNIEEKYRLSIQSIDEKIAEARNEISLVEEEIKNKHQHSMEMGELRKKLKTLRKKLKLLEDERKTIINHKEEEINILRNRYDTLIENEKSKVKQIKEEIRLLKDELKSLKEQADREYEKISNILLSINNELSRILDEINNIQVNLPVKGEGIYYLSVPIIVYKRGRKTRAYIMSPSYIEPQGKLLKRTKIVESETLKDYLATLEELVFNTQFFKEILNNNLVEKQRLPEIEFGLRRLVEKKILREKEVKEIIDSLKYLFQRFP